MTATAIVDFRDAPDTTARRRLADLPDRVIEGDPRHVTEMRFESPDGALACGTWTSTPGTWHAFTGRDEFCTIVSGHVRLTGEDGTTRTFRAGDSFLIPNGFRGTWEVVETTVKHFVIRHHESA